MLLDLLARFRFLILVLYLFFTILTNTKNAVVHTFQIPRHEITLSTVRLAKNKLNIAERENAKEKHVAISAGSINSSAFIGAVPVNNICACSSVRYRYQMKRNDDEAKDDYYNKDILDEIFGFIEGTSLPLLPNTKPISIVYPLALSTLSFILPLPTTLLLDIGFAIFLYLGRSLAVADQEDDESDAYQGKKTSLLMSDFAALGAAVAFAGLLSPQGLGNGSIVSGGGLVAVGATSLLAGLSAVLSAITSSPLSENGKIDLRKETPAKSIQPKDNNIGDSVDYYSERDKEILKQWDEKYNRGPK